MSSLEFPVLVLVETMGAANLGAVARTAAAFGLSGFRLVAPRCEIDEETRKWACYGKRVFDRIEVFDDLASALADVPCAIALSRRRGKDRYRHYTLPVLGQEVMPQFFRSGVTRYALVFGNEESGLARHHLSACHCSAEIPVLADDGSLNLAHAVSITLYELLGRGKARLSQEELNNEGEEKASEEQLAALIQRCRSLFERVGYPKGEASLDDEMVKLQAVVLRSGLERWEHRLLSGMISQVRYALDRCAERA